MGKRPAGHRDRRADCGDRAAYRDFAARHGLGADPSIRAGPGLHHGFDSAQIRGDRSGFLRLPGVLRPAAPGARRGVVSPGAAAGEPERNPAERDHADSPAGGAGAIRRLAARGAAGEHAAGALRGFAQHRAPARMAAANDRRRAPHLVLRLAAHGPRSGFRTPALCARRPVSDGLRRIAKAVAGREVPACAKPGARRIRGRRTGASSGRREPPLDGMASDSRMDHAGRPGAFLSGLPARPRPDAVAASEPRPTLCQQPVSWKPV